ncbi:MAG: metallophosphoesterase family protein [Thermoleophilia bacterium]
MLPLLRALSAGGDRGDNLSRLQDYLDGLEAVATQLTQEPRRPERASVVRLLLASDIHDNLFGMRAAARLAGGGGDPVDGVLLAGDLTDHGTRQEAQLFRRVFGALAAPVVVVGGNHEDSPAMNEFARAGYRVLEGEVAAFAGVRVLGASDPLSGSARVDSDVALLAAASGRLADLWRTLAPRPQVLLVHDLRQAQGVAAAAKAAGEVVLVAYGNDHVAGVRRDGSVLLVDAGTAGASGYEQIGAGSASAAAAGGSPEPAAELRDRYTFQLLDYSREAAPQVLAVTTVSYALDGRTVVDYTPLAE